MVNTQICKKCSVRIPKNHPKPYCILCNEHKHFPCQKLSKTDAKLLVATDHSWICNDCRFEILPVGAADLPVRISKFKIKCTCCDRYSYAQPNTRTCHWCDNIVHAKCFKQQLGCLECCRDMIPGFDANRYELFENNYNDQSNNVHFNPYDPSHVLNQIGDILDDAEHGNSIWNDASDLLYKCKYKQLKHFRPSNGTELQILSLNIQSLSNKIPVLRENITDYQNFDILCFSETNLIFSKLPNGMSDVVLDGFHDPIIQTPVRRSGRGGGLVIYVNKRVCDQHNIEEFNPNPDPANGSGEFLFIKLHKSLGTNRTLIVGNVYRSPALKNCARFNILFESVISNLHRHASKQVFIVGDFNIDLIHHDSDIQCQNLINNASKLGFVQIVSRPTRITDHSATLIDHVYTNNLENTLSCNILTVDISDHLATVTAVNIGNVTIRKFETRTAKGCANHHHRMFNAANDQKFQDLIYEENWDDVYTTSGADAQYIKFSELYTSHYNTAYPVKGKHKRRKNERKNSKPWILPWLEAACARKNNMYHTFVKNRTGKNKNAYVKMKQFVNKHTKLAKDRYYKHYFDEFKDNSKMKWQMINTLLGRKSKQQDIIQLKNSDGTVLTTPADVSSEFNNYFSSIASNLKTQIKQRTSFDPSGFKQFLHDPVESELELKPVQAHEIHTIIKNFKNKSTLDTKISALKVANTSFQFTHTLAAVINNSFVEGTFPQPLKRARVVPIHKGGSKSDASNYRPISLLSAFSKIYEKLMHNRVLDFLNTNGSLFENQYGFRPGRSCEHALLNAQNTLLNSLNNKQVSLLLLIDFSKAFDMVDHTILLHKLNHYGIRGPALKWFESYLGNRTQFVTIDGVDSSSRHMAYGVPQGSILGPLLFIIYINDLPGISNLAKFILYADDANIIISGENIDEVQAKFSILANNIVHWVDSNGLALNLKKTNYMIFTRQRTVPQREFKMSGRTLESKSEARFLGVIIDNKLTWTKHIMAIKSKMSNYIGIMFKIKSHLPIQARLNIFQSFVQSHLNFCPLVWGFSSKYLIESLFTIQKKAMRAVMPGYTNYFYRDGVLPSGTKTSFMKYNILTVHGIILRNAFTFMHRVNHFPASYPSSITETIPDNVPTKASDHNSCQEWLNKYSNVGFRSSIFFKGPLLAVTDQYYSTLTPASYMTFKAHKISTKSKLLDLQNEGENEEWPTFLLHNIPGLRKSVRSVQASA